MTRSSNTGFDRTYCYPRTNILRNKLDIHDAERLHETEREYTSVRINELMLGKQVPGRFDTEHLKAIHGYIFQDIYDWAGKFRTVDIAKSNMFCRVPFMQDQLDDTFRKLKRENYLRDITDRNEMGNRLGYYLAEINAVHPFQEGNGRTQRQFVRELAKNAGYQLDYAKIPNGELLKASIQSFNCDYDYMQRLITDALSPIPKNSHESRVAQAEQLTRKIKSPDIQDDYTYT